jgi:hypothetical protein
MSGQSPRPAAFVSGTQADAHGNLSSQDTLSVEQIAARYRVLPETISRLVYEKIFPAPDAGPERWCSEAIDHIVESLCRDGVPRGLKLPYSCVVPRRVEVGAQHLHPRWRHREQSKPIKHPRDSVLFVCEWFACERRYAAGHAKDPTPESPTLSLPPASEPTGAKRKQRKK